LSELDLTSLMDLQLRLGVSFRDLSLLQRAITHRSAAAEDHELSNERLEFLGDSILGLVICDILYKEYPDHNEGELAKFKAYIVSENSLADAAFLLGLEEFIVMSNGEATSGGRRRRSILSDALEAIIGAIYLDKGITSARKFIRKVMGKTVANAVVDQHRGDFKSSLQERTQAICRTAPIYRVVHETGRDHDKTFSVEATLQDRVIGAGVGKTKKQAEQAAAENALHFLTLQGQTGDNTQPAAD
jgi:ribonuclease III